MAPRLRCDGDRRSAILTIVRGVRGVNDRTLRNHGDHGDATAVTAVQAPQWHRTSGVSPCDGGIMHEFPDLCIPVLP